MAKHEEGGGWVNTRHFHCAFYELVNEPNLFHPFKFLIPRDRSPATLPPTQLPRTHPNPTKNKCIINGMNVK